MIQTIKDLVSAKADTTVALAKEIWGYAELSYEETKSAAALVAALKQEGFTIEEGIADIPTAFTATYQCGSGKPVVGFLAEYDALSGLSQKAGCPVQEPVREGGAGHGCGHNLLGAGCYAAAVALKDYLIKEKKDGTVIFFGCPAEEGAGSKQFIARAGYFDNVDFAYTWHPETVNEVGSRGSVAIMGANFIFDGIAAHAGGEPHLGRSALDAVELMNIGVQFLREHMSDKARIHYAITDAGGRSPNVVQPRSTVLYMVRSNHVSEAIELQKRVDKIADGAALMTETTYDRKFIDGLADTVPNHVLEALLHKNFEELGVPGHTAEELAFADALSKTYEGAGGVPGIGSKYDSAYAQNVKALRAEAGHAMNDFLLPLYSGAAFRPGSTDVGDVSWKAPVAQCFSPCFAVGTPLHSWQLVSQGRTSIAHKGMLLAGKVLAATAIRLFSDSALLEASQQELRQVLAERPYRCPIPAEVSPSVLR